MRSFRQQHGGEVYAAAREHRLSVSDIYDFSASINPLGVPASVKRVLQQESHLLAHYPDHDGVALREAIAQFHRLHPKNVVLGNGSTELIYALPAALRIRHGLVVGPTFTEYERALRLAGARCSSVLAQSKEHYTPPIGRVRQILRHQRRKAPGLKRSPKRGNGLIDTVFLCNPNSPTGQVVSKRDLQSLIQELQSSGVRLVVDEVFIEFCASHSILAEVLKCEGLLVLRSFTKFYAIPGLRLGYVVGPAPLLDKVRNVLPPWSVNVFAQLAGLAVLKDRNYRLRSVNYLKQERRRFVRQLQTIPGLRVYPSHANFVLVELPQTVKSANLAAYLKNQGILIRECSTFPGMYDHSIRLAVRRKRENDRLLSFLPRAVRACS